VENPWNLKTTNLYSRLYPNNVISLYSKTLLSKMNEKDDSISTTQGYSLGDPVWSGFDRYFSLTARKGFKNSLKFLMNIDFEKSQTNPSDNIRIFRNSDHSDQNRWLKRGWGLKDPIRLIKFSDFAVSDNLSNTENSEMDLFRFRFNDGEQVATPKTQNNVYFSFKQKKYAVRKKFAIKKEIVGNIMNEVSKVVPTGDKARPKVLVKNNFFSPSTINDVSAEYKLIKKAKKRSDLIPVPLAKRLLRTKRTLVLPAHVNLTIITNSYDVVHSWFIPSLGVKMDCVPGRSTHHVLYIDSVGFYYGQCAEICGRYHHHMPIRICALPFEHFLLWWHSYGAPKLLFTKPLRKSSSYYSSSKYVW
jgi:heme/copper-type cytochrome/quinol oxidase subunit 2